MTQKKITKKELFAIISENIGVHVEEIFENSLFIQHLGCDSIDMMEISFDVENFLDVQIDDDRLDAFKKVSDLFAYIKEKGLLKEEA